MTVEPVLVTGAAGGSQGSTGFHVTRLLLDKGRTVRAFVHRLDDRSDRLRALGAEVVEGDLRDFRSVAAAMGGIHRAYFAYPVQEGLLEAAATFAAAARSAGVEQVVNLSQWLQEDGEQPTPHQDRHWLVEQIFDWADVGAVHLDATVFYENLCTWALSSLTRDGVVALPWGPESTAIPMVGAEDVARVAAAVLTGPVMPRGTVVRLMAGGFTNKEIAEAFGDILGGSVGYVEVTDDQWASAASAGGVNAVAVEHLTHLWRYLRTRPPEYQAFYHISDAFERFTSQPPQSLPQFLREHKDLFGGVAPR
ncbi:MAG: NmrA family NAD(P)-binding protein [Mycobacterium sp.]|uniref:NmrA family NAD(P)-binding protein n=2 Tax=Mycobacterium sp. TaxID=1785 RepID=UPI003F9A7584